jgi:hypothetical protein
VTNGVFTDRELGDALRRAGLNTRALAAWAGTDRISALPSLLSRLVPVTAGSSGTVDPTPAAAALAMFVGGARVPCAKLGLLGDSAKSLARRGLVEIDGDQARATVAIVPVGPSLFVCDRLDAPAIEDLVCWPDDSSHHLAACLPPGRRERWLDLGCGSGFAPLARPELAVKIGGTDINDRALQHAALGASLSGVPLVVFGGDVGSRVPASWRGTCELVTCNAPMPAVEDGAGDAPIWRHAASDIVERMVDAAASFAARDATIVIHAAEQALASALVRRRGDRVIVRYTPDGVQRFAVAWWQPGGEERLVQRQRLLTPEAPHLTFVDR